MGTKGSRENEIGRMIAWIPSLILKGLIIS